MKNEMITLNELINVNGLATTQEEIAAVLEAAKPRENFYFVGTNVYEWLKRFTILNLDDMQEKFVHYKENEEEEEEEIDGSHLDHEFTAFIHDNSYNWGGKSNTDIDYKFLECENGNIYAYVRVHIGVDIRGGYTDGILIDLETESYDGAHYSFLDTLNEVGSHGYVTVNGDGYSIQGDITGEWLSIYNHNTDDDYDVCDSVYEWSEEKFNDALVTLVLEALEQNKK